MPGCARSCCTFTFNKHTILGRCGPGVRADVASCAAAALARRAAPALLRPGCFQVAAYGRRRGDLVCGALRCKGVLHDGQDLGEADAAPRAATVESRRLAPRRPRTTGARHRMGCLRHGATARPCCCCRSRHPVEKGEPRVQSLAARRCPPCCPVPVTQRCGREFVARWHVCAHGSLAMVY